MPILKEIFREETSRKGMEMSVTRFDVYYPDAVKVLGEPHDKKNSLMKNNSSIREAEWDFSLLDTHFTIRYDTIDWMMKISKEKEWDSVNPIPIKEVGEGKIVGNRNFVESIILPLIYLATGKEKTSSKSKRNIIKNIL